MSAMTTGVVLVEDSFDRLGHNAVAGEDQDAVDFCAKRSSRSETCLALSVSPPLVDDD